MKQKVFQLLKYDFFREKSFGGWYLEPSESNSGGTDFIIVMFQCPHCGNGSPITGEYSINSRGEVSVSFVCSCGKFNEKVVLKDWNPNFIKSIDKYYIEKI